MVLDFADKIDRRLIALLQSDARATTTTLAKKLGLARTTVHERIMRLERTGLIRGYSVVLNRNPFRHYVAAILLVSIVKQKQNGVVDQLKRFPEVKVCQTVNGECDLVCEVEVPQLEDLEALLVELSPLEGIREVRSMIVTASKFDRRSDTLSASLSQIGLSQGEAG